MRKLTNEYNASRNVMEENTSSSLEEFTSSSTPYSENNVQYDDEQLKNVQVAGRFDESPSLNNPFTTQRDDFMESFPDSQGDSQNSLLPTHTHGTARYQASNPYPDYRGYYSRDRTSEGNNRNVNNTSYDGEYTSSSNSKSNLNTNTKFNDSIGNENSPPNPGKYISTSKLISDIPLSNSFIHTPKPFDRYPKVSSTVPKQVLQINKVVISPTETNTKSSNHNSSSTIDSSSFGSKNNGFIEKDFSPFGGYPKSLFPLSMDEKEVDDYLHNPNPEEEAKLDRRRVLEDLRHMNTKSLMGFAGLLTLFLGAMAVFIVLPALTFTGYVNHSTKTDSVPENVTFVEYLTEYQYPQLAAIRTSLIDPDTPTSAYTKKSKNGDTWQLVFSDEFNAEGRTFYEGDDQFWTSPNIHYAATNDLEWYSPDSTTTSNGTLKLRMDAYKNHNLFYRSGMLQSWNKFCFTQGSIEVSANLPNYGRVAGLWPGIWTMGNLARPGYLASTEGLWPYSYDSCDAGITPNQSSPDGISYLPGQRLSACTCDDEDTPSPGIGRGAPEIDVLEGSVDTALGTGVASQSLQVAPFDIWYIPDYEYIEIYNFSTTAMNSYTGGPFQQAISAVTTLNTAWYEYGPQGGYYQTFGMEYLNDDKDGYVQWSVGGVPTFTLYSTALHPNGNIGWRTISKEPMSIILNLGISNSWDYIDWPQIFFPVTMSIDYVRIYQPKNAISTTCDPEDFPTYDYIESHKNAYTNANLTSWKMAGYTFPKNALTGNCKSSAWNARKKKT
ncbi:beta-glucan synthesis-associated protein SKN1 PWA37_004794 [Arxiozyma heterogenica]|uniref:beta-glucan synthesis-associated protein SKN1 n=1 Tax=Arxiozyma heterogenica TaxID=278026 RepID=UPI002EE9DB4B